MTDRPSPSNGVNTARIVRAGAKVPEICMHNVKLGQGCFCPHCPTACFQSETSHCIDCIELKNALASAVGIANEARECHDRDQDMRVMKILIALSGYLPKYRADTDRIHDVLKRAVDRLSAPIPPVEPADEQACGCPSNIAGAPICEERAGNGVNSYCRQERCSTCNDTGEVDESLGGSPGSNRNTPCPDCRPENGTSEHE